MKEFLSNIWLKRAVSVFNIVYFAVVALLTYATFLYDIEFTQGKKITFFTIYVITSALFLLLMFYTKDQIVSKIIGLFMLPVVFFLIIFNMTNWILIMPPFIAAVIMFFAVANSETTKVVFGTMYLLLYVLGLVAYFVMNMLVGGTTVETPINSDLKNSKNIYSLYQSSEKKILEVTSDSNSISPDGKYQFILYDVKDSDKGEVKICVIPHNQDIKLSMFTLKQKGVVKTISNKGTRGTIPDVGWIQENGQLKVQYRLTTGGTLKKTSVTTMPDKQYLEFLGFD